MGLEFRKRVLKNIFAPTGHGLLALVTNDRAIWLPLQPAPTLPDQKKGRTDEASIFASISVACWTCFSVETSWFLDVSV